MKLICEVSHLNLPYEKRQPTRQERGHDDAQGAGRLPLPFHFVARSGRPESARVGIRFHVYVLNGVRRRQRSQGAYAVDL